MSRYPVWPGLTALLACAAGCTSWSQLGDNRPVPARGTIQAWRAEQAILLRDPRTEGDSLVGRAPLPDTARRAVALTSIDSLRTQSIDAGKVLIVSTGVAMAALLVFASGMSSD